MDNQTPNHLTYEELPTNSNNALYKKYEKVAYFIEPRMSAHLVNMFNSTIKNRPPENYLYTNYMITLKPVEEELKKRHYSPVGSLTLLDIISVCVFIALSQEPFDKALRTAKENRRVVKRNWTDPLRDEIMGNPKPKNRALLRQHAETIVGLDSFDASSEHVLTVEGVMQDTFAQIEQWRLDPMAPITDFIFLAKKNVRSLCSAFMSDVTFDALTIIKEEYGGSIEGINTRLPSVMNEHAIFSYRNSVMELEPQLLALELQLMNNYCVEDSDRGTVVEIKTRIDTNLKVPASTTEKNIPDIIEKNNIELRQRSLDTRDKEIVARLFSMINGETIHDTSIRVDLRDFIRKVYKTTTLREKLYNDLKIRLEKLKTYNYSISIRNKDTNEEIESIYGGLLDHVHIFKKEGYFEFIPSKVWVNSYVQQKYISILTESFINIESPQAKSIMFILQQERLNGYAKGNMSAVFPLKFFRTHLKLDNVVNSVLAKELRVHLQTLMDAGVVVQNFTFINRNSSIKIDFTPLTEKELVAYDFNPKAIEKHGEDTDMTNKSADTSLNRSKL